MVCFFFVFSPFKTIARSTFVFNFPVCNWQGRNRCVCASVCVPISVCEPIVWHSATLRLCRLSLPVKTTDDEVSEQRSRDATWGVCLFACVAAGRPQIETWCVTWHDDPFPRIAPRPWQQAIYMWVAVTCEGMSAPSSRSALQVFSFFVHQLKTN